MTNSRLYKWTYRMSRQPSWTARSRSILLQYFSLYSFFTCSKRIKQCTVLSQSAEVNVASVTWWVILDISLSSQTMQPHWQPLTTAKRKCIQNTIHSIHPFAKTSQSFGAWSCMRYSCPFDPILHHPLKFVNCLTTRTTQQLLDVCDAVH